MRRDNGIAVRVDRDSAAAGQHVPIFALPRNLTAGRLNLLNAPAHDVLHVPKGQVPLDTADTQLGRMQLIQIDKKLVLTVSRRYCYADAPNI